jgi:hypothetical protein
MTAATSASVLEIAAAIGCDPGSTASVRKVVAEPGNRVKRFRGLDGDAVEFHVTSLAVTGTPEARMIVYTPIDEAAAQEIRRRARADT